MGSVRRAWIPILILHLFSVFVLILQITNGAYVEQFLESVEVCTSAAVGPFSNLAKKKIRLANYPNNTVMVKLTRWDEFWPSFLNFRCKFQVTAPKNYGVMVVIQAMHLRTRRPNGLSCKDYIKFEQDDGFKTGQICGEVDDNDYLKSPQALVGQRNFYDNKGQIDVSFSTDDKDLEEEQKPVFLKMIFTAYSECSDIAISSGRLKRCSTLRSHSCIASSLFCDGEINCGFNDADFGWDERDCDGTSKRASSGGDERFTDRPASLYVFAITCVATLVIVVILVLVACCCIRRFTLKGQAPHPHHQSSTHLPHENLEFHMATTSPTVETETPKRSEKRVEDLPPAYDALFPTSETTKKQ